MPARIGRQIVFFWGGTVDPTNVITGIREVSVEASGEPIDITSNDNAGVRQLLSNVSAEDQVSISVSGVTKDSTMKEDWFAGTREQVTQITYPDAAVLNGTFYLSSYSEGEPYNDASTFEATLVSNGAVTYTP